MKLETFFEKFALFADALDANAEMIALYWDIGRMIAARQEAEGWGAGVLPRLAVDLKNALPEHKGFSLRNLKLMVQFYHEYPHAPTVGQRAVAPIDRGPRAALKQELEAALTK